MLTFVLCMPGHSKSISGKACLYLKQQDNDWWLTRLNCSASNLGVVEVNDCAIILDHVHLLNAGNIVH